MSENRNQFSKKDIERLVSANSSTISFDKPKENRKLKISKYWMNFSQVYVSNVKQNFIVCDNCKTVLIYKTSTGSGCMKNHAQSCKTKLNKTNSSGEQPKINNYCKKITIDKKTISKEIKRDITISCAELMIEDGRPFELIKGPGFLQLAQKLFNCGQHFSSRSINIEDLVPDSTTTSRCIDQMYDYYKQQLIEFFTSMDSYCVIVDFWTESFTGLSFCGISVSHIDVKFRSYMFSLGCFPYELENKRAPTIRSFVEDTLKAFGLELGHEKFVVTDNEPNMLCTFGTNCKRVGCSDHYINKQLQHTFTTKKIDGQLVNCDIAQDLFSNIKFIVSKIRQSHKQINLSKKLVSYSETRFSGAYAMLDVFLEIFDELIQILDSRLLTNYSQINKDLLLDICRFLLPFDTVITALSDDQRPTLHRVLPFKQYLMNKCEIYDGDDPCIEQIKSFLSKRLEEKWELTDQHFIAAVLHPNNKHLHKSPQLKERALSLLKKEMTKHHDRRTSTNSPLNGSLSNPSSTTLSSYTSLNSITNSDCLDARKAILMEVFEKPSLTPEKTCVDKELEKYLSSTLVLEGDEDGNLLLFWRDHKHLFPLIAAVARDILAIPASNTSVERQFSCCKNLVTEKRTRLGSEKLNKLIFLKKNMNILKEKFPVDFTQASLKRKRNEYVINDERIQKKNKETDSFDNQNEDQCFLIESESDNDEDFF